MAIATYQGLCIDAVDAQRMARFWAPLLQLDLADGDTTLRGPTARHSVWINEVPEPVTVKQRVHLDVRAERLEEVVALGATVVDDHSFPWAVVKDVEGGELCVFGVPEGSRPGLMEIVVDTADPVRISTWWADVLGAERHDHEEHGFSWVAAIAGAPFEALAFVPVPEAKIVKNRIHIDVTTPDLQLLVEAGARLLRAQDDEISWNVLADPDGNEFCAFVRDAG
jgi:hypothetical protein